MSIRTIIFDDETQTAWYIIQDPINGAARRVKEHIECPREYFKRKLMGK